MCCRVECSKCPASSAWLRRRGEAQNFRGELNIEQGAGEVGIGGNVVSPPHSVNAPHLEGHMATYLGRRNFWAPLGGATAVAVIAGAALLSACSQPSDSEPPAAQQQAADDQAAKNAEGKAWADAEKAGTVAAYTGYLQNFGSGAHVSEASQRIAALNERAPKDTDDN